MSTKHSVRQQYSRMVSHCYATDILALTALLCLGLFSRWLLFDHIAVWGDFGFYTYDAQLILDGETPFIDFLGRSPLFLYAYAAVASVTGEFVHTLRWFSSAWYLLTAIPVYLIGLSLRGRRVAVLGTVFFLFAPFALAYGMRASTQSMALFFSMWGVYAAVRSRRWPALALAGGLVALGFLARQSMIAIMGGLGLWVLWLAYREQWTLRRLTGRVAALSLAFLGTLVVGYTLVVGSLSQGLALFDQQVLGLFFTSGRGGLPLIGVDFPPVISQSPGIPVLNAVCPQCGPRTARVFSSTIVAGAPVLALLFWLLRDWLDRIFDRTLFEYLAGILAALGLYASIRAFQAGFVHRPVTLLALLAVAAVVWTSAPLPRERLYQPTAVLLVLLGVSLSAGYLVRDRMVANYYFLDFWPVVALLAGFLGVLAYKRIDRPRRVALVGLVLLLVVTSAFSAHPLASTVLAAGGGPQEHWFSMDNLDRYEQDLDERIEPGEAVFAGHPTYLAGSHAEMPMDDPRIHYRYSTWATADGLQWPAKEMFEHVKPRLAAGEYQYVILDSMTARILQYDGILTEQFTENYCRVKEVDELYADTGAQLYEYQPDCASDREPTTAMIETIARANYYGMDEYDRS